MSGNVLKPNLISNRLPILDGWRGLAVIFLLAGHYGHVGPINLGVGGTINLGRTGVELFFVLSGALLGRLLFIDMQSLSVFYKRRISRILPASLCYVVIVTLVTIWQNKSFDPITVLSAATFWINYRQHTSDGLGPHLDHFWSLSVEEHSYIILSIVALAHRKLGFSAILSVGFLVVTCFTCALLEGNSCNWNYYEYYWRTECRAGSIFLGTLFALIHEHLQIMLKKFMTPLWLSICFTIALLTQIDIVPDVVKYSIGSALFAFCVNNVYQLPQLLQRILEMRWIRMFGLYSFSIYLWQQWFIESGMKALPWVLPISLMSFYFVELPGRRHLNRILRAERTKDMP